MKKAVSLFVVSLFAAVVANAQAAGQVDTTKIERNVRAQVQAAAPSQAENVEAVIRAFELFKANVASHKYYEWSVIFQQMDDTREAYMKLHGGEPAVVKAIAEHISQPISINNGAQKITIPAYVRMESVTLWPTEQQKFDEFGAALEADLKLEVATKKIETKLQNLSETGHFTKQDISRVDLVLPVIKEVDAAAKQIKANMYYPTGLEDKQAIGNIFQSFSRTIEEYNALRAKDMKAAGMAATYISQKVFTTKDGKTFNVVGFISQFEAAYMTTPGGFDEFKDNVRNDAGASSITILK